jgi:anti-sigma factor RsiW
MQDCQNVEWLLDAYIDNELLSSEVAAVQKHLESCSKCSAHLNDLLALKEGLRELSKERSSPHLRARILGQFESEKRGRLAAWVGLRWRPLAVGALATLVVLAAFLGPQLLLPDQPMYSSILLDHSHQLSPDEPTDMMSKDPEALWRWLNRRASFKVPPSLVSRSKFDLVGGRVMKKNNEEVVSIRYEVSDTKATFHVMESQVEMPASAQKQMVEGIPIFIDRYRGYNIVMWEEGGLLVCAVSALNEDSLLAMIIDAHPDKPMEI